MKPNFALILDSDGIRLLHRVNNGWRPLGAVAPDDPALAEQLQFMRRTATDLSGGRFATKIVIPNDQILYCKVDALGATDARRTQVIRQALEGMTPYPVEELAFDWCDAGAGLAQVAVVARETLDEAEDFAAHHRFNPISFVAMPTDVQFDHEPFFGPTHHSETLLSAGDQVEPDREIITILDVPPTPSEPVAQEYYAPIHKGAVENDPEPGPESDQGQGRIENRAQAGDDPQEGSATASVDTGGGTTGDGEITTTAPAGNTRDTTETGIDADAQTSAQDDAPQEPPAEAAHGPDGDGTFAFSTRRSDDPAPTDQEPLRLKWVTPRIAIGSGTESAKPRDGGAGTGRPTFAVPPAPMQVTSPKLGGGAAPAALYEIDDGNDLPGNKPAAQPGASTTSAPAPVAANKTTPAPVDKPATRGGAFANTAPPTKAERGYLGLKLTVALLLLLGAIALISSFFSDTPVTSSRLWQGLWGTTEATVATQTGDVPEAGIAGPVGGNGTAQIPVREIELASLNAPDVPSGQLSAAGTDRNAAEFADPSGGISELSLDEAQALYETSGIWQAAPAAPIDPDADSLDDLYVASIDRMVIANDAIALPPAAGTVPDAMPRVMSPPAPAGTTFDLDERGLVRATPDGALSPDGIPVYAGRPPYVPLLRPGNAPVDVVEPVDTAVQDRLAAIRPVARPTDLIQSDEKSRLGGRTRVELAGIRPLARPRSPQDGAAGIDRSPTKLAVASSRTPTPRPNGFSATVEQILARVVQEEAASASAGNAVVQASAAAVAPSAPSIPSKASVAKAATVQNAIKLSSINLIGVYGSSSSRRALVRLKSGRYVKVQVGDKLDGGRVAGISTDALTYTKSGRNITLKIPNG